MAKASEFWWSEPSCELVLMLLLGNTDDKQGGFGMDKCSDSG